MCYYCHLYRIHNLREEEAIFNYRESRATAQSDELSRIRFVFRRLAGEFSVDSSSQTRKGHHGGESNNLSKPPREALPPGIDDHDNLDGNVIAGRWRSRW